MTDPGGAAIEASRLFVGTDLENLKRVSLDQRLSFPSQVEVIARKRGAREIIVEARAGDGAALARGRAEVTFKRRGKPTDSVALAFACSTDEACQDEIFCDGTGYCLGGACVKIDEPCGSSFECVASSCVEEERRCEVTVSHGSCNIGLPKEEWSAYCSTDVGCVEGAPCLDHADCDDQDACNGAESCENFHCVPGVSLPVDDEDPCTVDGCNTLLTGEGLDPVFHLVTSNTDGLPCALSGGGVGICRHDVGGCWISSCGDGVVDVAVRGELCDDGALNSDTWSFSPHCNSGCDGFAPHCGDASTDAGNEACDDGAANSDGWGAALHCNSDCTGLGSYCGDGFTEQGFEFCDEGVANSGGWSAAGHCNSSCTGFAPFCGDGQPDTGFEFCDDGVGNRDVWSTSCRCDTACSAVTICCGDGNIDTEFESCDDGDTVDSDNGCSVDCKKNDSCGDGIHQWLFESCDDGNNDDCMGSCLGDCSRSVIINGCGDGVVCPGESCDEGVKDACGNCNATCTGPGIGSVCGDGDRCLGSEVCEDGFADACGDCNATCTGAGSGWLCGDGDWCPQYETCDEGYATPAGEGSCLPDCSALQICGDGLIRGSELCDDGDLMNDLCTGDCLPSGPHVAKLLALDGGFGDAFGGSVSLSGEIAVIGAPTHNALGIGADSGAAYLFERNQGGADNWGEVAKLLPSDLVGGDLFGRSVSVSGDSVVVGASTHDAAGIGTDSGAAYLFERNQGGTNNWGQVGKLLGSDTTVGDLFGRWVSMSGDSVVVGALGYDGVGVNSNSGAAYLFERNQGGANSWGQVAKLLALDAATGDLFGRGVSVSGDSVVVASSADAAYVFDRNQGGPNLWGQVARLAIVDGGTVVQFGSPVFISGDTVAVGAYLGGGSQTGASYLFARNQGGADNWGQAGKLLPFDGVSNDSYGWSISQSGRTMVVGATRNQGAWSDSGSAYVHQLECWQCGGAFCPCASCSDGVVDVLDGEQCDDNNSTVGDGCSGCIVEPGFTCRGAPSVCVPGYEITSCPNETILQRVGQGWLYSIQQINPCTILDVNVYVSISHPATEELQVELRSPVAPITFLHVFTVGTDIRGNYDLVLAPHHSSPLTDLDGTDAQGQWGLFVGDLTVNGNQGTLNCWKLHLLCQ